MAENSKSKKKKAATKIEGLNLRQVKFCDEFLIDRNATQAAIRAGYSKKTAGSIGLENLGKPLIDAYIKKREYDRAKRTEITQDMVLQELAKIAFADIKNYLEYKTVKTVVANDKFTGEPILGYSTVVDLKDSNTIDTSAISEVSVGRDGQFRFKMYAKDNALIQIGKHLGMFKEKEEEAKDTVINIISSIPRPPQESE